MRILPGAMAAGTIMCLISAVPAQATVVAHFVDSAFQIPGSGVLGEYDSASITIFIDPAQTRWIGWNNADTVQSVAGRSDNCSLGEAFEGSCLGPYFGSTDDSLDITVTNPGGTSSTVTYDANTGGAVPTGQQGIIFGSADDAPDVFRNDPANVFYILDEAGAQNSLFTTAGDYTFDFSWQNDFAGGAGHPNTWLLVDVVEQSSTVPEPGVLVLLGVGLAGLAIGRRRRYAP